LRLYIGTGGKLIAVYGNGSSETAITGSTTTFAAGTLYHVAVKWSSSGVAIYVNGSSEGSNSTAPSLAAGSSIDAGPPLFPGTVANAGSGASWVNLNNVKANDNTDAYVATNISGSMILKSTAFGFTIPTDATIQGIELNFERWSSNGDATIYTGDALIQLYKAGTLTGSNIADHSHWETSRTVKTYGGATSLWGTTWSKSDIENSGFGVGIQTEQSAPGYQSYIDYVTLTVYYTTPAGTVYLGSKANGTLQLDGIMETPRIFSSALDDSDILKAASRASFINTP
jgi:hypothetical protein